MKSLFTSPLNSLTFGDIVTFCEIGTPESVNLDYKIDFPQGEKLARTVSAFANTFGGVILIGVDEDEFSRPKPPVVGIAFAPKLEERVWSTVIEHIYPPVFPEVHVCAPENGRTFVIIRVPQSSTAPHAVRHQTSVYLRTGKISKPEQLERLASLGEVDWLRDRRKRAEDLRDELVTQTNTRLINLFHLKGVQERLPKAYAWIAPKYPVGPLLTVEELSELRRSMRMYFDDVSEEILVHQGVARAYSSNEDIEAFSETSTFGLVFESRGIYSRRERDAKQVFLSSIIDTVADVVHYARRFFPHVGYFGICEVHLVLTRIVGMTLIPLGDRWFVTPKTQLDERLEVSTDISAVAWTDGAMLEDTIAELVRGLAWSFGWKLATVDIVEHLKKSPTWRASD